MLTAEQREFIEESGPVTPSGGQTFAQAIAAAAFLVQHVFQLEGWEPIPRECDLALAYWRLSHDDPIDWPLRAAAAAAPSRE